MKLIIGNKNYSSWSLRAWFMLSAFEVEFDEVKILLCRPETKAEILKHNKAGKVPALHDGDLMVWDSIAICEYISEKYLANKGWPEDLESRAIARACTAEMHSGFFSIREMLPMNCRANGRNVAATPELEVEIKRVDTLWAELRRRYGKDGEYLFGRLTIADCMFAPVVFRFLTYGIEVSEISRRYMETVLAHPKIAQWLKEASEEEDVIESVEVGM